MISVVSTAVRLEFSALYDEWFDTVYRWIRALGGAQADSEDLAQDVFVVVQRKLPEFDGKNLSGWLYRITEYTVRDYRRLAWFRNIFLRPRDVVLEDIVTQANNSEELALQRQDQERFYRLVARMSGKWRESFILFEIEGYSGDEIAALRGIPSATVRTHLSRARKEFMTLLEKELAA